MISYKDICEHVRENCAKTGEFILNERKKFSQQAVEIKGNNDFVSYVDKTAEQQLVTALEKIIPEAGFIAEENTSNKKGQTYNWIIDPLDGTTNFIHGLPVFCISIGLMKNDKMVLGVVHELNFNECFYAWNESPAYLNGNEIKVTESANIKNSLFATGFPYYDYSRMNEYIELFKHFMQHSRGLRRLGSAAADLAYVACGRLDGFFEYGLRPWDVAAGSFIVQQAGGKNFDFKGKDDFLFGKEIVSCNSSIAVEMEELIKKYF
jgi:myo-inositol-1(or 4)-monophosphatase